MSKKEQIIEKLKENGCRITKQRKMLIDIILENDFKAKDDKKLMKEFDRFKRENDFWLDKEHPAFKKQGLISPGISV